MFLKWGQSDQSAKFLSSTSVDVSRIRNTFFGSMITFRSRKPLLDSIFIHKFIVERLSNHTDGFRTQMAKLMAKLDVDSLFHSFGLN